MTTRPIALDLFRPVADALFEVRPALVGIIEDLIAALESQLPDEGNFPAEPLRARLTQSKLRVRTADTPDSLQRPASVS